MRAEAEVDELRLVEVFLSDRLGEVDADRAERRFPGKPDAGGQSNRTGIGNPRQGRLGETQRAGVDERLASDIELAGQTERVAELRRADVVELATERILAAGVDVARADAG